MKAGREIDALVAEKVMGFGYRYSSWRGIYVAVGEVPHYSTRIQDAWLVVERLMEKGWSCNIVYHDPGDCLCEFWGGKEGNKHWREIANHLPSVPLAICLVALKAVE